MSDSVKDKSDSTALDISSEERLLLDMTALSYTPSMIPPHTLSGAAMVAAIWYFDGMVSALVWGALYFLVTTARVINQHTGPKLVNDKASAEAYSRRAAFGALAASLCWGGTVLLLFPEDPMGQFVFLLFNSLIAMVASIMLAHHKASALAFCVPMTVAMIIKLATAGSMLHIVLAVGAISLLGMQVGTTLRQNRSLKETFALRYENQYLLEQLTREKSLVDQKNRHLVAVLDNIAQGLAVFEPKQGLVTWNKDLESVLHLSQEMLRQGLQLSDLLDHLAEREGRSNLPLRSMLDRRQENPEVRIEGEFQSNQDRYIEFQEHPMPGEGQILTFRDITQRKEAERLIHEMAMTDGLTGLANRHNFNEKLKDSLSFVQRDTHKVALACLDLDRFKQVNDSLGHPAGDEVLRQVADILRSSVREVDTVARLGGDEFAIIFNGFDKVDDVRPACERILQLVASPLKVDDNQVAKIGTSIGIALVRKSDTPESVFMRADQALYASKQQGRNRLNLDES